MYKILTHMHTQSPSIHRYHRIKNEAGEWEDFESDSLEEVEAVVLEILQRVGSQDITVVEQHPFYIDLYYEEDEEFVGVKEKEDALNTVKYRGWEDLKISDDKPFTLDLIWGEMPVANPETYTVQINSSDELIEQPIIVEAIKQNTEVAIPLYFSKGVKVFHLVVDGQSMSDGIPEWIKYEHISDTSCILKLINITSNHIIDIVVDAWEGDIVVNSLTIEQIEALNSMTVLLGEELSFTYDKDILDIDFELQGEDLIVTSHIDGVNFKINENKELEVTYNDGNSN